MKNEFQNLAIIKNAVFCHFGVCRRYKILQKLKICAIRYEMAMTSK
jgi:hypothetical protein